MKLTPRQARHLDEYDRNPSKPPVEFIDTIFGKIIFASALLLAILLMGILGFTAIKKAEDSYNKSEVEKTKNE